MQPSRTAAVHLQDLDCFQQGCDAKLLSLHSKDQKEDPFTVRREGLIPLAARIRGDFPFSGCMHNSLLMHGRGHAHECTFYTLREKPDSHVVMWRYLQPSNTLLGLHCLEEEVGLLRDALLHSELIDWRGRLCVFHVPEYLLEAVKEVVRERGGEDLTINKCYTFTANMQFDGAVRCPPGVRVARLGRAGVRLMRNTSEFDVCRPLDDMVHIARHAPSAGAYEDPTATTETLVDVDNLPFAGDEEEPLAWVTTSFYGGLGTLATKDDHRGRGLGNLVTMVTGIMQLAQGYIAQGHVDIDNLSCNTMNAKETNPTKDRSRVMSHYVYFMFRR